MNVFDLAEWKRQNITEVYHKWQNMVCDALWVIFQVVSHVIDRYFNYM